jgi:glycosyltransferase involved in cell wall biosynthesis
LKRANFIVAKLSEKSLRCPTLKDLPPPPPGKTGWPWTEQSKPLPDTTPDGKPWPKVSVVTPSYNQGRFIEECIRSVLLQGYPDLEYIIIDGGSTDQTVEVIKKYERWLTYWESLPDRGQSHAISKGLLKSTGRFFNWHNSDDVLTPNSVAATAAAMVKYPQAGYAHGYRIIIDDRGTVQGDTRHSRGDKTIFSPALSTIITELKAGCQPGCLMDRQIVVKTGMIDENLHYVMDVDVLLRIALEKPPVYIPFPVVYLRAYPDVKSLQWNTQRAKERICIANKIFSRSDLPGSIKKLKRRCFETAHQFAWQCYAKAKNYRFFLWHFVLDVFYAGGRGWKKRLNILFGLRKKGL